MKILKSGDSLSNPDRPVIYLGGGERGDSDLGLISDMMRTGIKRGTLLIPGLEFRGGVGHDIQSDSGDYVRSRDVIKKDVEWGRLAMNIADIVAFWFSPLSLPSFSMIDLGIALGRYMLGAGPKKIIVAGSEFFSHRDSSCDFDVTNMEERLDVCNAVLSPGWYVHFMNMDEESFVRLMHVEVCKLK